MKVLSIDSPYRLKDRTVKAIITVAEDDMIPLIMLADRAYKGDVIEIDDAGKDLPAYEFDQIVPIMRLIQGTIEQREKEAEERGYQKAKEEIDEKEEIARVRQIVTKEEITHDIEQTRRV